MSSNIPFRLALASLALGMTAACSPDRVTGGAPLAPPSQPGGTPAMTPPRSPRSDAIVYDRTSPSRYAGDSRFVLFPNGTFKLEYGGFPYPGTYTRVDSIVDFAFDDWVDGAASGRIRDNELEVDFNDFLDMSDFEDGTYSGPRTDDRIYLASVDGAGSPIALTRGDWPSWSPDGSRLAFQRDGQVCVIEVAGTNESCLTSGGFPSWSPDGRQIVFTNGRGVSVMRTDDSLTRTLIAQHFHSDTAVRFDLGVGKPAWSPDGQNIAFEVFGDGFPQPPQIFVMHADGSAAHRLTAQAGVAPASESDPAWSSDGSSIVFWSSVYGVARVAAGGGVPTTIFSDARTVGYGTRPAPSPDGSAVAYTVRDSTSGASSIWITGRGRLIPSGRDPAWSPDGKWIAYVRP